MPQAAGLLLGSSLDYTQVQCLYLPICKKLLVVLGGKGLRPNEKCTTGTREGIVTTIIGSCMQKEGTN